MASAALLDVRGLVTEVVGDGGAPLRAVDDVSLSVGRGGALGMVGESGAGKTLTALSLLRLLPPRARVAAGSIGFDGRDLAALPERELRAVRGARVGMVFQEAMSALHPAYTVGRQVGEPLEVHRGLGRRAALAEAVRLLALVGMADPARRARDYPHQLSGGMRQRALVAMALACGPELLVADEPTSALDVTLQADLLDLFARLRAERGMALLLVTHDLAVVAEACDEVVVMYAGQVVERAPVAELFRAPRHPYTAHLASATAWRRRTQGRATGGEQARPVEIAGVLPRLDDLPPGCRFAPRCDRATGRCASEPPALAPIAPARLVRCHFPVEDA